MIFHNRPTIGRDETLAISRVINSRQISKGYEVEQFQREFARYLKLPEKNVVAVNNGTSALFLALWVLNAKKKNIIYPTYSCSSLRHATAMIDGKENLRDTKKGSPNMEIGDYKKNSIVINPNMYGFPSIIEKKKQLIL